MGQSVFPVPSASSYSVPNWQLLQTATPSGVATVTFSGLSGYSKYCVRAVNLVSLSGTTKLQCNGDSAAHYSYFYLGPNGSGTVTNSQISNDTAIAPIYASGTTTIFDLQIDDALTLAPKSITGCMTDGASYGNGAWANYIQGLYGTSSLLTSLTIARSANFTSGSIYLLGAN